MMFEAAVFDITQFTNPNTVHKNLQFLTLDVIFEEQQADPAIRSIITLLQQHATSPSKPIPNKYANYKLVHNSTILARKSTTQTNADMSDYKIVLPLNLLVAQAALLHSLSHASPHRVYAMFLRVFYAQYAVDIISRLLATCQGCRYYNPTYLTY